MKCKGIKANGDPCGNNPVEGSEYCKWHQPGSEGIVEEAKQELVANMPPVKQVVRYISKDGTAQEGSWLIEWIDDYLAQYLDAGYELKSAYPFDQNQFGIGMVYVLALGNV